MAAILYFPFYLVSLCFYKSKKICLFGAWQGNKYSDNAKAVFEAMSISRDIKCYWIYKNKEQFLEQRNNPYFVYAYSFKGILLQLVSSSFVYSSGYDDFITCLITVRAKKINLWHGIPLKKIGYSDSINQPQGVKKSLRDFRNIVLPFTSNIPDYVLSNNEYFDQIMREAFKPKLGVITSGLPRNDVLKHRSSSCFSGRFSIIYCPTFRDKSDTLQYFDSNSLEKIQSFCEKINAEFKIKLHPADSHVLPNLSSYHLISDITEQKGDLYSDILNDADVLVTDYSSVMFDFALTEKPVVLYPFDLQDYMSRSRELYFDYENDFSELICMSWSEVLEKIESDLHSTNIYKINDKFDHCGKLGSFSEKVADEIRKVIS